MRSPLFYLRTLVAQCLRLLQRLMGIDHLLAKNALVSSFGYGVSFLRGIITGYFVARMLPREVYGEYRFVMSIFGMISVLSLPNIANALFRAIARGEKGVALPVGIWQFFIALPGAAALLIVIPFLPRDRMSLWPIFVLAACLFPLYETASTVLGGVTVGRERFDVALWANVAWSTGAIVATLLIIFLHPSPLLLFLTVIGLPSIAYFSFSVPFIEKVSNFPAAKSIVLYGLKLSLIALPMSIAWYLDDVVVSAFLGLNQLAVFSVATIIPEQVKSWCKELLPVSYARQARGTDTFARRWSLLAPFGRLTFIFSLGIFAYILLTRFFFQIFFPNYMDAVLLSQIAAATIIVIIPGSLITQYMEAHAMLRPLHLTQWISAGLFCISLFTLIPAFHLIGAVLSLAVLRLSNTALSLYFFLTAKPMSGTEISQTLPDIPATPLETSPL